MHAEFTSTSELPFASLERVLVLNVSHENDLIFMRMNVQEIYTAVSKRLSNKTVRDNAERYFG